MEKTNKPLVVLFEDDRGEKAERIESQLRSALRSKFELHRFDLQLKAPDKNIPYEDLLANALAKGRFKNTALIVSDRDISRSLYPGLSEVSVTKAAAILGVPICVYSSGRADDIFERQRTGGDGRIVLDSKKLADVVPNIAQGMLDIRERLKSILNDHSSLRPKGAPRLLARVLNEAEVEEHLALYARGDQQMIVKFLPEHRSDEKKQASRTLEDQRMATALGVWLYDSVLRFPGLVLDSVAAGSFLGIDPGSMTTETVRGVFKQAEYRGPFASPATPYWWRFKLVALMAKAGVSDGRELLPTKSRKSVPRCTCSVDHKAPAGAVCVVTRQPVCEAHSVGQISWLPRGADLARVTRSIFDEIAPWVGS